MNYGYMWALFCAVLWGIWYIPGTIIWALPPFDAMYSAIADPTGAGTNENAISATLVVAVLISSFNALTVIIAMLVWNGVLGKFGEMKRTMREFNTCSKWFYIASIFGGPMAILGSFIAIGFIGAGFAAVAALLYPVIGAVLAYYWYGEKITKRAAIGIFVIIAGGFTIFVGGAISELSAGNVPWIGYVGGLMAALPFIMQLLSSNSNSLSAQPDLMRAADSRRRG